MNLLLFLFAIFFIAVVLQGLFAGYETGFVSSNPIRVRYLAEVEGSKKARRLLAHIEQPDSMIAMLLLGTNLMVVAGTLVVSRMVQEIAPPDYAAAVENIISFAVVAPVFLLFAEIIPKSIFRTHPTRLTLALYPVISFFYTVMSPLGVPLALGTRGLLWLAGARHQHIAPLMATLEDVRVLVDEGVDHGTIEREEQEMIHSVIDLQSTTAKEIMVPRIAIEALPDSTTRGELVEVFAESERTRIPIYRESVDTIIGVVNVYSLLADDQPECEDIGRLVKDIMHVPDTMKVGDLFRAMKDAKQHIAIVTDEYGGTDGLITMEDILEEIFGEIQDEYDHEESRIHKLGPSAYVVDARVPLEEISQAVGMAIEDEIVETVGGWLMHIAGHIPTQGEVVQHGRFKMTVLAGGPNFVSRIRIEVVPEEAKPPQ
jgi:CBS domain containing-hemolysin-like protein